MNSPDVSPGLTQSVILLAVDWIAGVASAFALQRVVICVLTILDSCVRGAVTPVDEGVWARAMGAPVLELSEEMGAVVDKNLEDRRWLFLDREARDLVVDRNIVIDMSLL